MTHLHCDSSSLLPAHYFLPRPPITSKELFTCKTIDASLMFIDIICHDQ
uniref:Uncharacterized protein n=1 Tax=Rhizophora mucronata TaxID=61149 RepID=A0A2P2K245_RHIMU